MWFYDLTFSLRPLYSLYWSFRMLGDLESIPRKGPAILAINHSSFLDPWWLSTVFPRRIRYLITRKWYDKSPLWHWVFSHYGTIPVQENEPQKTMQDILACLEDGEVVGIFPEGKISYDGKIQRFRSGIAYMAAHSGAPVVPIGIRGSYRSLPRTRRFPRPGRLEFWVGRPLVFPRSPWSESPPVEEIRAFRDRVFEAVCRLAGQEDRVGLMQPRGKKAPGRAPARGRAARH